MSKTHPPELKKYMDKEMELKLNGNRRVSGVLRGFDPFMNMVIEVRFLLCLCQSRSDSVVPITSVELASNVSIREITGGRFRWLVLTLDVSNGTAYTWDRVMSTLPFPLIISHCPLFLTSVAT